MSGITTAVRTLAAAALVLASSLGFATTVGAQGASSTGAGIGIRLVDAPVALKDDPRAKLYIIDHLPPGQTIERHIEVSNGSSEPMDVDLYAAAAEVSDAGGFDFGAKGEENELTSWTKVEPGHVALAPGEKIQPLVTIAVPSSAMEAARYGVIWAQTVPPADAAGLSTSSRVGVRMYLDVGPGNGPAPKFDVTSLNARRADDGRPQVVAEITNTGKRAMDPRGSVNLHDGPGGMSLGAVEAVGRTIGVGNTGEVVFDVNAAAPAGPWKADVTLTAGTDNKKQTVDLTFPDAGSTALSAGASGNTWLYFAIGGVGAAAIVAVLFFIRAKRRNPDVRTAP